jgi:hypothetical protein
MPADAETTEDLNFIRHELDSLVESRSMCGGWRPADALRYATLCEREKALVRRGRQSVGASS